MEDLEYGEKTDKRGKEETHIVELEMWRETLKTCKMRNTLCNTLNTARNSEKLEI
jgi:hypothetical protein